MNEKREYSTPLLPYPVPKSNVELKLPDDKAQFGEFSDAINKLLERKALQRAADRQKMLQELDDKNREAEQGRYNDAVQNIYNMYGDYGDEYMAEIGRMKDLLYDPKDIKNTLAGMVLTNDLIPSLQAAQERGESIDLTTIAPYLGVINDDAYKALHESILAPLRQEQLESFTIQLDAVDFPSEQQIAAWAVAFPLLGGHEDIAKLVDQHQYRLGRRDTHLKRDQGGSGGSGGSGGGGGSGSGGNKPGGEYDGRSDVSYRGSAMHSELSEYAVSMPPGMLNYTFASNTDVSNAYLQFSDAYKDQLEAETELPLFMRNDKGRLSKNIKVTELADSIKVQIGSTNYYFYNNGILGVNYYNAKQKKWKILEVKRVGQLNNKDIKSRVNDDIREWLTAHWDIKEIYKSLDHYILMRDTTTSMADRVGKNLWAWYNDNVGVLGN